MVFICTLALCILSTALCSSVANLNLEKDLVIEVKNIKQTFQDEVDVLKKRLDDQKRINEEMDVLKRRLNDQESIKDEMVVLKKRLNQQGKINDALVSEIRRNILKINPQSQKDRKGQRDITKRAFEDGNVAFTAYLDHNVDSIGHTQIIPFNHVLLNYGNAYNNFTNIFTAPIDGVYSFSFFIGQRHTNEARANLNVNNQPMVSAAVETVQNLQDSQGGNTANLMLSKGDTVYVTHSGGGTHIEGNPGLRTTTFSGFLLFPIETPAVVG